MTQIVPIRHWRFGRTDRIVLDRKTYRYVGKKKKTHILQRVQGDFLEDDYLLLSDRQVSEQIQSNRLTFEKDHFSRQVRMLRARFDTSRIDDLEPVARMHLLWRYEWVRQVRDLIAMNGNRDTPRIARTGPSFEGAIAHLLERMNDWFEDAFRDHLPDLRTKDYPAVPSGSTLYAWLLRFEEAGCRIEGLRDGRERSGRRGQLHDDVVAIIEQEVEGYRTPLQPKMAEIVRRVHDRIWMLNAQTGSDHALTSPRIVAKHIRNLDPFLVDAARLGSDVAVQRHAGVGRGAVVDRLLQRVEIDDWEFDLHVIECSVEDYEAASPAERRNFRRIRPTATIAIDAYSRTIVGFHLSPYAPSSAGSIACLRSVVTDKCTQALDAGCRLAEADEGAFLRWCELLTEVGEPIPPDEPGVRYDPGWSMFGRPELIVTDGGPAFDAAFDDVARAIASDRSVPEKDPRLRGRIERFFRTLQGAILHFFSGRTFSNVAERGDYDSARMASVTFEELRRFCIRFIVDIYHRTPHRGLAGRQPANFWRDALAHDYKGVTAFATEDELRYAFAVRHPRTPTREGIRLFNLSYWSRDIDRFRAVSGRGKIACRIDAHDISSILVDVPTELRKAPEYEHGLGFVVVPHVGPLPEPIAHAPTLENWQHANSWMRDFVRKENDKSRPIRIAARQDLFTGGREAMERAGVLGHHELTEEMLARFQKHVDAKRRNAANNPADRKPAGADPLGRHVADAPTAAKSKKTKKAGRPAANAAAAKSASVKTKSAGYGQMFRPDGENDAKDIEVE